MPITVSSDFSVFPLPRVIRIEPSGLCNLRCTHCPTGVNKNVKLGIMSKKVFSRIVEELKSYKGVDVVVLYHSGEPFLNKNIFEMIHILKALGIRFIKTVTNGMLIKNEMLPMIIESGLDSIEFSLDGLSPEENNQIRRGGDYYKVASIIKGLLSLKNRLRSLYPEVYIVNTQIPNRITIKKGVEVSTPKYIEDDFSDFKGQIGFKNTYMRKWPGFKHSKNYELVEGPTAKKSLPSNYCNHVVEITTLRWNGDVVPCCYDITNEYVIGNVLQQPLRDIWNNEKYRELRRSIHLRKYLSLCVQCKEIKPQLVVAKIIPRGGK